MKEPLALYFPELNSNQIAMLRRWIKELQDEDPCDCKVSE